MEKAYYASIAGMPRLVDKPVGRGEWELVLCPTCGTPCWERPKEQAEQRQKCGGDVYFICTECMKKYVKEGE